MNIKFEGFDRVPIVQTAFLFGMSPVVDYLRSSLGEPRLRAMGRIDLANAVYRMFEIISQRTRLAKKFSSVLENDEAWLAIEAGLQQLARGAPALAPRGELPVVTYDWKPALTHTAPWWSSRRVISSLLFLLSIGVFQLRVFFTVGRERLYLSTVSLVFFLLGTVYWFKGPNSLPHFILRLFQASVEDEGDSESEQGSDATDEDGDDAPRTSRGSTQAAPPEEGSAIARLIDELAEIRNIMKAMSASSPPPRSAPGYGLPIEAVPAEVPHSEAVQALLDFSNGTAGAGHISSTAHQQIGGGRTISLAQELPPPLPAGAPAWTPAGAWNPLANPGKSADQAGKMLFSLRGWMTQKEANPWWGMHFYQDVARLEASESVAPDVLTVLRSHGYNGAHSSGAPRDGLKNALGSIRAAGSAFPGDGGFAAPPPGMTKDFAFPQSDTDRWQGGLPPDMPRAAPSIYRSMRSEGVGNIREWISGRYKGNKSHRNTEWVMLWNAASKIDFKVDGAGKASQSVLANDDAIEIDLRTLASYVHVARTGDWTAGTHLLAIKPPGTETDVAPDWLLKEATAFSTVEHQRSERVKRTPWKEPAKKNDKEKKGKNPDKKGKDKGKGKGEE